MENLQFNFSNPIDVDKLNLGVDTPEELVEEIKEDTPIDDIPDPPVDPADDDLGDGPGNDPVSLTDGEAPELLNMLSTMGYEFDIPEGIDPENIGLEEAKKILEYRDQKLMNQVGGLSAEQERKRIVSKLDPLVQQVMTYNLDNPNADETDIMSYIESMTNVSKITGLDPEKDAEKIVREYYKASGFNTEDINEKVEDLVSLDKLSKEANRVKPKLDSKALSIVEAKQNQVKQIQDFEKQRQDGLHTKAVDQLSTGKVGGVDISQEEAQYIYAALMNNEVPVNIKGKKVEMGYLEALIMKEKYEGNLENVMLASLVLAGGKDAIEKFFAKGARTQEVEKFTKHMKFSNKKKTSVQPSNVKEETGGFQIKF